mgnify:CR=1 FL=1
MGLSLVQYVYDQCKCFDPLLMDASRVTDYGNLPFCPILRSDLRRQCASDATTNFGKEKGVNALKLLNKGIIVDPSVLTKR